jgi:hypothetical protein
MFHQYLARFLIKAFETPLDDPLQVEPTDLGPTPLPLSFSPGDD